MNYLLDTCLISELAKKRPAQKVVDWVRDQNESSFFLSVITIGEVRKGIEKLSVGKKRTKLEQWLDRTFVGGFLAAYST